MDELFQADLFKNERTEDPWTRKEDDKVLDLYLAGAHPKNIALTVKRNPKAINRRIEQFRNNERDRALRYEPGVRVSRKGKRFTENETMMIKAWAEAGIPTEKQARILARDEDELTGGPKAKEMPKQKALKVLIPAEDLIWAHRYLYFVYETPVISDETYDAMVQEEIEYGTFGPQFEKIKAAGDKAQPPEDIRCLALYLALKKEPRGTRFAIGERTGKGEYQFWYGPVAHLPNCLSMPGKSAASRIVKLNDRGSFVVRKWNGEQWMARE